MESERPIGKEALTLDINRIDSRLREVDRTAREGAYAKRKEALVVELEDFLGSLPGTPTLATVSDRDLRRFLVFKDRKGKTQVHDKGCAYLGEHGLKPCGCPKRLAAGTVETVVGQLRAVFSRMGRGNSWSDALGKGNPAYANSVQDYVKVIKREHSEAHVTPKQAKPLFLGKLEAIGEYLDREASCPCASVKDKFTYMRDKAFLTLQFHAGDRASDVSQTLAQEIRSLPQGTGLMLKHTTGKCTSSLTPKTFVVRRCANSSICPVASLENYVRHAAEMAVDLRVGYIFRKLSAGGEVLDLPITYDMAHGRLLKYLQILGIYEGETPHSLRGGCAVTMMLTGAAKGVQDLRKHVGWRSHNMPERYARAHVSVDMTISERLKDTVDRKGRGSASEVDEIYAGISYETLPVAFP